MRNGKLTEEQFNKFLTESFFNDSKPLTFVEMRLTEDDIKTFADLLDRLITLKEDDDDLDFVFIDYEAKSVNGRSV